jgi:hypothetical protein
VLFIPSCPGHTGLTGALDRSDWCNPCGVFAVVPCCYWFGFGSIWSSVGLFGVLELSSCDRSDGVLHRSDRCGAFLWKSPSFTSRDRSDRWCSPV